VAAIAATSPRDIGSRGAGGGGSGGGVRGGGGVGGSVSTTGGGGGGGGGATAGSGSAFGVGRLESNSDVSTGGRDAGSAL